MEALGINLGFYLVQVIGFTIIVLVLRAWVFTPVVSLLEKRRASIAQGLEDARIAGEARANAEKEAEKIRTEAQTKASETVREATVRAEQAGKDILAAAEADATRIRAGAASEADREKERVLADLRPQVAALAMAAAQKLLGEALDEKRQRSLLEEFFSGVKAGKVVVLEGAQASGLSAEVTSALPLTKEEQETIKKEILAEAGSQTVTFRVDPGILGGLIVKIGDRVVDGSVAGQLAGMRQSLS